MPGYHSRIKNTDYRIIGNLPILTFKSNLKGPINQLMPEDQTEPIKHCPDCMDIIEESLYYFRANVFLKKFEIKNHIDRLLIYLTLYTLECIKLINRTCVIKKQAKLAMINFARNSIWMHDDTNFILNFIYKKPEKEEESEYLKNYLHQLREELGQRLCELIFLDEKTRPNKWWMCFARRSFLNLNLKIPCN